jgi:hypothetical protein
VRRANARQKPRHKYGPQKIGRKPFKEKLRIPQEAEERQAGIFLFFLMQSNHHAQHDRYSRSPLETTSEGQTLRKCGLHFSGRRPLQKRRNG